MNQTFVQEYLSRQMEPKALLLSLYMDVQGLGEMILARALRHLAGEAVHTPGYSTRAFDPEEDQKL